VNTPKVFRLYKGFFGNTTNMFAIVEQVAL
jgi:hypothetical protein